MKRPVVHPLKNRQVFVVLKDGTIRIAKYDGNNYYKVNTPRGAQAVHDTYVTHWKYTKSVLKGGSFPNDTRKSKPNTGSGVYFIQNNCGEVYEAYADGSTFVVLEPRPKHSTFDKASESIISWIELFDLRKMFREQFEIVL